jgi:hypothetical protein
MFAHMHTGREGHVNCMQSAGWQRAYRAGQHSRSLDDVVGVPMALNLVCKVGLELASGGIAGAKVLAREVSQLATGQSNSAGPSYPPGWLPRLAATPCKARTSPNMARSPVLCALSAHPVLRTTTREREGPQWPLARVRAQLVRSPVRIAAEGATAAGEVGALTVQGDWRGMENWLRNACFHAERS